MTETLEDKIDRYRTLKGAIDEGYRNLRELEHEILADIQDTYPEDFHRWERGVSALKVAGAEIPLDRRYNTDRLRELLPDVAEEVITVEMVRTEKINGRKLVTLWRDAEKSRLLEQAIEPPRRKLKV